VKPDRATSLVRSAAKHLRHKPLHTLDLAREVLGLDGHAGAASAAVFQLLGGDPRFLVDGEGVWRLDPAVAPLGVPLSEISFQVVDVETTGGGQHYGHRITDFAAVEVVGGEIVDEYQTLVNPGRRIPVAITALTGITDDMVAGAPYFEHVADGIAERLHGSVFVAHNVAFDWGFVSGELVRTVGDAPAVPRICTVRMVRRLVPAQRRRNLDVVTRHFGVKVHERHRAYGDALATARVFIRLLDEAMGRGIEDLATLEWYLARRRQRMERDPHQTALFPNDDTGAGRP
jgi:DNA polymerase III epsilon subunit family exonuclease